MKKLMVVVALVFVLGLAGCKQKDDTKTIVVLTSSGYEPYEMVDTDGNLTGFDIELMEALAAELGYELEWKDVDFNGIIGSLQSGQEEIAIAGITPTDERKESVDFSDVYYNSEGGLQNFMVFDTTSALTSLADLDGKVVGVQLGTIQEELANKLAEEYNFTVTALNNSTQIVEEIKLGSVDAMFVESVVADAIMAVNDILSKVEIDSDLDDISGNAIAFSKGSDYVDEFNTALQALQDNGKLDELIEKYFGTSE